MDTCLLRQEVYLAAKEGNLRILKCLLKNLKKEAAVEILSHHTAEDGHLTTPLIIAAHRGQKQITKWLLSKYNIDLEQTGTLLIEDEKSCVYGKQKEGFTALWAAVFAGYRSIVRQLLKHGADVNHPNFDNQSPLWYACFRGRSDIMDVLIKHGADVNTSDDKKYTCLMLACFIGDKGMVKLLLDKGAEIDAKSCDGWTALHEAAKHGKVNNVKILLHRKATMQEDDFKMTPLLIAAEHRHAEVVDYLVSLPDCTVQQRVDAFEILGASMMTLPDYNLSKACKYLHMGMSERYRDSKSPLVKNVSPPKLAYGNHSECKTLDEIDSIAENVDALLMEALSVRERILGEDNPLVRRFILIQADMLHKFNKIHKGITLRLYATALAQKNNVYDSCSKFAELFSQMMNVNADIDFGQLLQAFELVLTAIQYGIGNSGQETLYDNIQTGVYLIMIMLKQLPTEKQIDAFHQAVYRFLKPGPRYIDGYTPLHMAMDSYQAKHGGAENKRMIYLDDELCDLLLNCGADVNALDDAGNTPLHVLVMRIVYYKDSDLVKRCALSLIRHGAHLDVKNKKGKTVIEVSESEELKEIFQSNSRISLKCLASRAIKRYGILFNNVVPKSLEEFVDWH